MGLETGVDYINDLVSTNPTGTDPKGQGDDHIRNTKRAAKQSFAGFAGAVLVTGPESGSANTYVVTPSPAVPSLKDGMFVVVVPQAGNTGASTLNVSSLGAKSLRSISGDPLGNGEIVAGMPFIARYDEYNDRFRLTSITKQYADQLAFGGSLPSQGGNAGKKLKTDGTNGSWVWSGINGRRAVSVDDTIVASDNEKLLSCSGSITLSITAAATLGNQFGVYVYNVGTGVVTLDPNGSETIDGASTKALQPGDWALVFCDATGFYTISNRPTLNRSTRTSNTALDITDRGTLITVTSGTFTQTAQPSATLGPGWFVDYQNEGTGTVTIDPNGSETIGGASTLTVGPGEAYRIQCDGSNLNVVALKTDLGPHLYIREEQTSGAGSSAPFYTLAASWQLRYLNTTVLNTLGATLLNNEVTLPAGRYSIKATGGARGVNGHRLRIYNVTSSTVIDQGANAFARFIASSVDPVQTTAEVECVVTFSTATKIRIEHYTAAPSNSGAGWESPIGSGDAEVFAQLWVTKR